MPSVKIKRGTRAQITTAATNNQLAAGEPYLITDEARIAVGTSASSFMDFAKLSEAGGGGGSTNTAIEGGFPDSSYAAITPIDGGTP